VVADKLDETVIFSFFLYVNAFFCEKDIYLVLVDWWICDGMRQEHEDIYIYIRIYTYMEASWES
jgi:hypothetical protein